MKASIDLKIQGVRGGTPSWNPNKGYCALFIDNMMSAETRDDCITVDDFEGIGDKYKRREQSLITVQRHHKTVFIGTFDELYNKLSV